VHEFLPRRCQKNRHLASIGGIGLAPDKTVAFQCIKKARDGRAGNRGRVGQLGGRGGLRAVARLLHQKHHHKKTPLSDVMRGEMRVHHPHDLFTSANQMHESLTSRRL
jgi:alkylated DNA nucleotide flippase Atl1